MTTAPRDDAQMMATQALTILAAAIAGSASMEPGSQQAQLAVTATVVRPAEIVAFPSAGEGAVVLIRNTEAIEVVADGGTVRQLDGGATAVTSDVAGLVTITLEF